MPVKKTKPEPANNPNVLLVATPNGKVTKQRFGGAPLLVSTRMFYDRKLEDHAVEISGFSASLGFSDILAPKPTSAAFELRLLPHVVRDWERLNGRGWRYHVITAIEA